MMQENALLVFTQKMDRMVFQGKIAHIIERVPHLTSSWGRKDMLDPIPHSDTDPFFQIKDVTTFMPSEVESIVIR